MLVTFHGDAPFLAHPRDLIILQAKALEIEHRFIHIKAPFMESYRTSIMNLSSEGIQGIFTGDILDVCSSFLDRVVEGTPVELLRPLYFLPRKEVIDLLLPFQFDIVITCCSLTQMSLEYGMELAGKRLNKEFFDKLVKDEKLDSCGENGEYHSMVLDAPLFKKRIEVKEVGPRVSDGGKFIFYDMKDYRLVEKN
ncbi:hypothetical protein SmJEL517_g02045 [Synchytrium microbalum]|uniref:Diphthamide synthase domain-containing protein n=1 Tax=Synchytrium microbalum TaxID=1806994 RepID=A0A507CC85_9FUNG|nr:uncharacterized protein SmJEL517_g02045 [Synchytrium microbalum]TPX35554.1 hypothetical protein SmJEL517_g02045 [Synchytrium microbalum]